MPAAAHAVIESSKQRRRPAGRIEAVERLGDPREPGARQPAPAREPRLDRS